MVDQLASNQIVRVNALARVYDPTRIRIFQTLIMGETCVCRMVGSLGIKHSLLSHHLSVLAELRYIESDRNGNHVLYQILEARRPEIELILALVNYHNFQSNTKEKE